MRSFYLFILMVSLLGARAYAAPMDDFAAAIEGDLDGRCVGYGYAILQNGQVIRSGGGGAAQLGDPENIFDPGIPFTADTVKDCHSVSKTITAVALLRALAQAGVSLDTAMWTFLPADLQGVINDPNVANVTFRRLLNHRSGFAGSNAFSWAQLKNQLQGGLANPIGTYEYSNWNYAVCRLLIPYILNLNFYRSTEAGLAAQGLPDGGVGTLDSMTSNAYISWVRNQVFAPSGLGTIHPRPVEETLPVFGWYYDHSAASIPGQIMPDRRLTVGSGGWALSARQYGRFISALFRGELLSAGQLGMLQDGSLGMFNRVGSNGSDVYYSHNGATTSSVGGRSVWMAFPGDIQVVVQVNSINNAYEGSGLGLDRIVQEAYERAFSTPPESLSFPLHLFLHRAQDGWITSRGVLSNAQLGARNFDFTTASHGAPAGMIHHRFFSVGNQAFLLRYGPSNVQGNGRAIMHRVNANGTLAPAVFDSSNWLAGWTHVLTFGTPNGTFLLLHNSANGRIRTLPISAQGNVGSAITDFNYSSGFDIAEILTLSGTPHILRHNSTTGLTHLRVLRNDGSVGDTAFSGNWSQNFTDWEIFRSAGNTFIFRYNSVTGAARINRVDGSLENVPQVLDQTWSVGWTTLRFFEVGGQAYFIRYNAKSGAVRIQAINANGTPGAVVMSAESWLKETIGTGVFNPGRPGWTGLEVYDATPGFSGPVQDLASYPDVPSLELIASLPVPINIEVIPLRPEKLEFQALREGVQLAWPGRDNILYFLETSTDLREWAALSVLRGEGQDLSLHLGPGTSSSARMNAQFYRISSMEAIPPLPNPEPGTGR
jgi:hypothetical protein